jgi:transposase
MGRDGTVRAKGGGAAAAGSAAAAGAFPARRQAAARPAAGGGRRTAFPGSCGPARPGAICRSVTGLAWSSVADTLYRWRAAGVRDRGALAEPQRQADARGRLDWSPHAVDGTIVRAHQHAAGSRRAGAGGGWSPGPLAGRLLDQGPPSPRPEGPAALLASHGRRGRRPQGGPAPARWLRRPPQRPRPAAATTRGARRRSCPRQQACSRRAEAAPHRRRIGAAIPQPRGRRPRSLLDRAAYRERDVVERLVSRLKQFRRAATRCEKRAANYLAMPQLAAILLWLRE